MSLDAADSRVYATTANKYSSPATDTSDAFIAFDLTKAEFGIPVVKIVIPGLEGIHSFPNYIPGPRFRRALDRRSGSAKRLKEIA